MSRRRKTKTQTFTQMRILQAKRDGVRQELGDLTRMAVATEKAAISSSGTALFYSRNLIGDALQAGPAIRAFYELHKPELTICVVDNTTRLVYERLGIPVEVIIRPDDQIDETQYDFVFHMDISRAWQVGIPTGKSAAAAFAVLLGVTISSTLPIYEVPAEALERAEPDLVLLQPYSRSCSSHTNEPANKRWLPDENWGRLYAKIKEVFPGQGVRVLGGPDDPLIPDVPREDHWLGRPLDDVVAAQKKSRLVVTIDSGVAHLAASQCAHTLEMYPICLPLSWMGKGTNPNWQCIYARPADLTFDYVWQCVQRRLMR